MTAFSPRYFEQFFFGPFKESATGYYEITEPKADALDTLFSIVASCDFKMINKNNGITFLNKKIRYWQDSDKMANKRNRNMNVFTVFKLISYIGDQKCKRYLWKTDID